MKRTAFVGLSGPLGYDYRRAGRRRGGPNPVLEGAMGLLLYYDEIVFVARGLCPANMRKLDYVHFLSDRDDFHQEMSRVRNVGEIGAPDTYEPLPGTPEPMAMFHAAISEVTGQSSAMGDEGRYRTDYHARVRAGGLLLPGRSIDPRAVIADWEIINAFGLEECDPIFNSASSLSYQRMRRRASPTSATSIADRMVVSRIPDYLGPAGPYHPSIEDLRQSDFLRAFRAHLDEYVASEPSRGVEEICREMEARVSEYERKVFLRYLSNRRDRSVSVSLAAITDVAGLVFCGVGTLVKAAEECLRARQSKKMRWAGFIAELDVHRGR